MSPFPSHYSHHVAIDWRFMRQHLPLVIEQVRKLNGDTLVGCGFGSIPWVIQAAVRMRKPYVLVRKNGEQISANGDPMMVVGRFGAKRRCVLIDDVVWRGRTKAHVEAELAKFDAALVGVVQLEEVKVGRGPKRRNVIDAAWSHRSDIEGSL